MKINVKEIKVIGNVIEDFQKKRQAKIHYVKEPLCFFDKKNPVCPVCNEKMTSRFGIYNGCPSANGDDLIYERHWEFECTNFHNCSWTEIYEEEIS